MALYPSKTPVFVEADEELADALRARLRQQGHSDELVRTADANSPGLIGEIRERCAGSLALTFVDFLGMEVTFDTLRRLTQSHRMDLLLTLQVNDLTRNAPLVLNGEQDSRRWDAFFGTSAWRDAVRRFQSGETGAPDLATTLTDFYCNRLGTLGYDYVAPLQRLMRNTINAPLYRLILAGKHPRAAEFFQKISRIEDDGQRGLPL